MRWALFQLQQKKNYVFYKEEKAENWTHSAL